jgi:putative DNA primase/helicase
MPVEAIGDPSRCKMQPIPLHSGGMGVRFDLIPEELKAVPHWMPWKFGNKPDKKGKFPKIPCDAKGYGKDYTNPANWMTSEQAVASCNGCQFDGIGYVFSEDDPFTGVDLDHCIDLATGVMSQEAQDINRLLNTYGEISPSGTGIKWIARGEIAHSGKDGDFEMYDHKRFFTTTGNRLPAAPATIEYRQAQLDRLNAPMAAKRAKKPLVPPRVSVPCGLPEQVILEKARNGKNGAKFTALWNGDTTGYGSPSEADLALCNHLAYWSDNDSGMVEHLFRQSGLYREEKWDRAARTGETYGQGTLARAQARGVRIAS